MKRSLSKFFGQTFLCEKFTKFNDDNNNKMQELRNELCEKNKNYENEKYSREIIRVTFRLMCYNLNLDSNTNCKEINN